MEETCQKCGHTRYAGDLFDGGCDDCCDWMVAKLAELTAERDKYREANESVPVCLDHVAAMMGLDPGSCIVCDMIEMAKERDALLKRERECREAWANRHGGIDGVFMSVKLSAYNILNRNLGE